MDLTDRQARFITTLPPKFRQVFRRAFITNSKADAIKAKCLDCNCYQQAETARCDIETCPLYSHNPYLKRRAKRRESKINAPNSGVKGKKSAKGVSE